MENSKLNRINELAALAKERELTEEEKAERGSWRKSPAENEQKPSSCEGGQARVRFRTHLYFLTRSITQGILPTSSRQVQA